MIISMRRHATREEIDSVIQRIQEFGYKIHAIEGEERVVIGAIGVGDTSHCLESLSAMDCVEKAVPISAPYKFVSREFKPGRTVIRISDTVSVGGDEFVMMAGPCSVESEAQILHSAELSPRAAPRCCAAARQAPHFALRLSGHGRSGVETCWPKRARPPDWPL